jgi:hypothetical protein
MTHPLIARFLNEKPQWAVQSRTVPVPGLDNPTRTVLTGMAKFAFVRWARATQAASCEEAYDVAGLRCRDSNPCIFIDLPPQPEVTT